MKKCIGRVLWNGMTVSSRSLITSSMLVNLKGKFSWESIRRMRKDTIATIHHIFSTITVHITEHRFAIKSLRNAMKLPASILASTRAMKSASLSCCSRAFSRASPPFSPIILLASSRIVSHFFSNLRL